jgi:hypothetical protein
MGQCNRQRVERHPWFTFHKQGIEVESARAF